MKLEQLRHLLRAAATITGQKRFLVIGSQSVQGSLPDPPGVLGLSVEADLAPVDATGTLAEKLIDAIDGTIGEQSPFHELHGYYAQGVALTTAVLPLGWEGRLRPVECEDATGYCLEPHDLALSKLVAGREKDFVFVEALRDHGLIHADTLRRRATLLPHTPAAPPELIAGRITRLFQPASPASDAPQPPRSA